IERLDTYLARIGDAHARQEALIPGRRWHRRSEETGRCTSCKIDVGPHDRSELLLGRSPPFGVKVAIVEMGERVHKVAIIAGQQGTKFWCRDQQRVVILDRPGVHDTL